MVRELEEGTKKASLPSKTCFEFLDKTRWFVLFILSIALFLNGEVFMTYETVMNQTSQYFDLGYNYVRIFFTVFLASNAIMAVINVISPQVIGYRKILLLGCLFNFIGAIFRFTNILVVNLNQHIAYGLALTGHSAHGMAVAFLLKLPTLISSTLFEEKEASLSTSIPFMANILGLGFGYLDIFILVGKSHDLIFIMDSFEYIFIFEAVSAFMCLFLIIIFLLKNQTGGVHPVKNDQLKTMRSVPISGLIKQTCFIIKRLFKKRGIQVGVWILTLNTGNYLIILVFLVEIVSFYSSNQSSITGYIGAVGVILGGVNTLIIGIFIKRNRSNNRIREVAVAVNILSALIIILIMIVIGLSKLDSISVVILFILLLSLAPIYISIGCEILTKISSPVDPNLSCSPALISANLYGAVMPPILSLLPVPGRYIIVMSYCLITYLLCATLLSLKVIRVA